MLPVRHGNPSKLKIITPAPGNGQSAGAVELLQVEGSTDWAAGVGGHGLQLPRLPVALQLDPAPDENGGIR